MTIRDLMWRAAGLFRDARQGLADARPSARRRGGVESAPRVGRRGVAPLAIS